ncbi:hypothetical protein [Rosistilla oblonga]|uniref:hypothetical protein n=1 Tax=Rosistilla oblonga TaxID=2527990 RepID=UPI003A974E02
MHKTTKPRFSKRRRTVSLSKRRILFIEMLLDVLNDQGPADIKLGLVRDLSIRLGIGKVENGSITPVSEPDRAVDKFMQAIENLHNTGLITDLEYGIINRIRDPSELLKSAAALLNGSITPHPKHTA